MFLAPAVPKTPPPLTPPPSKTNATTFPTPTPVISPDNSPNRNPSQIRPSTFPSLVSPVPTSSSHISIPPRRGAIQILMRAMRQGEEVEVREVNSVAQAEEWFGTLLLDD
ncbi:hypothetical protein C8R42DRAFT_730108 [Lentinula raphanica]|nr:hypothetical protein C8R42DRAFT_730108 [Lentinula raphanica]